MRKAMVEPSSFPGLLGIHIGLHSKPKRGSIPSPGPLDNFAKPKGLP